MFRTLYSKLALVLLAVCCFLGFLFVGVIQMSLEHNQQIVTQRLNLRLAEVLVRDMHLPAGNVDLGLFRRSFDRQMLVNPAIEIYLLDDQGKILANSLPAGKVVRQRVSLSPLKKFLDDPAALPIMGDDPLDQKRKKIFSVAPLPESGPLHGYLYVVLGGETQDNIAQILRQDYQGTLGLWVIAFGTLVAILGGLLTFATLTRRLKRLATAIDAFQRNDFASPQGLLQLPVNQSGDEIDRLTAAFNQMASRLTAHMQALQQHDQVQQEFLANISHDLRTPLAALRGYLETLLLKEGALSSQEQHNYLEIATKQSERLTMMVSKLFELAKLNTKRVTLNRESFQLGDLVEDVVQKFQLSAEKRSVELYTDVPDNDPFVSADIGLIERVLENLIENAMRYTPPGGKIVLIMTVEPQHVMLQVTDTGSGIDGEDLQRVFDRFYRGGRTQDPDSGNAGLGLAIVKSILSLHGADVTVTSSRGRGTTFSFKLPTTSAMA